MQIPTLDEIRRAPAAIALVVVICALCLVLSACGDDDDDDGIDDDDSGTGPAIIQGNISGVNPPQASRQVPRPFFAQLQSIIVPDAIAQSLCPSRRLLICVANGRDPVECEPVDSDTCFFSIAFDAVNNFAAGVVSFVDDVNQNGTGDAGEPFALLTNPLAPICNGSVVALNNVGVNLPAFAATAASVVKNPNTCTNPTPSGTQSPSGSPTPGKSSTPGKTSTPNKTTTPNKTSTPNKTATPGGTPVATATPGGGGGATPTSAMTASPPAPTATRTATRTATFTPTAYSYGASLQSAPPTWLAFLSGLGVAGLIVPKRRRLPRA